MKEVRRFSDLVGKEDVVRHMQKAIQMQKVSHAYIIGGEKGSGKKTIARLFATAMQCQSGSGECCNQCVSCKKAASGNHPDILYIQPSKNGSLGVDEIREQLIGDVSIKPYESPYKVYIVNDAHKMTLQAQNALLKTIEEPPAYARILLLADNPAMLLPTITSRCVGLNLKPVGDDLVKSFLQDELNMTPFEAEVQASFAQGNIGRAIDNAQSSEFSERTEEALYLLKDTRRIEVTELIDAVKRLSEEKQYIHEILDVFTMWFRDVLLFKATRDVDMLIFREEVKGISARAQRSSYEGLEKVLKAIQDAGDRLKANVNFDLVMELLFLTMREC